MFWSFYSQTRKMSTPEIYLEYHCVGRKKPIRGEKINCKQWMLTRLVCGFVASLPVQIFTVIGHNTRNIPEIFQVFPCFTVTTGWVRQMTNTKCLSFYGITIFQGKNVALLRCKLTSVYVHVYITTEGDLRWGITLLGIYLGHFRKPHVIANSNSNFTQSYWKRKEFSNSWQSRD